MRGHAVARVAARADRALSFLTIRRADAPALLRRVRFHFWQIVACVLLTFCSWLLVARKTPKH